ncbi:pseudouridine synthase [Parathielavia appendiculata]|uniref:Pseudouridine synthase n=1 Tax=Parathielavia appendiculata TaxID=2587402 RepID=A0AAN6U1P4_9PEZI|nr:pseudouridine synthase [Parathielavia appendiculata]
MSQRPGTHVPAVRAETEKSLGITQRSAAINFAWTGDIRKRYTDFLVNEIRKDGTVLHLRDFEEEDIPLTTVVERKPSAASLKPDNKPKVQHVSEDDRRALVAMLGGPVTQKLIELDEKIQAKETLTPKERFVVFDAITDRAKRGTIHQEIRRIFRSRFDTVADATGVITATAAKWAVNSRAASQNWAPRRDNSRRDQAREFGELGGEYLHFTLYKENKDTMDAVNTIARLLKIKASNFGFAGTKDRRAGTVQRISVYRQKASNLIWLNTRIPNVKVGDFEYSKEPLQLGQHGGNEFVITLKNCQPLGGDNCSLPQRMKMIQQAVECGLAYLKHNGYINYYGLQRFGTYTIGTHLLGMKILKGDYEGFIEDILHVDDDLLKEVLSNAPHHYGPGKDFQNSRDDHNRARGITTWKATKNAGKALEFLPKRFSSETAIIRHLGKNPKDFTGAVLSITRGMRMMYVHAYQSYVWNFVATRRWSKYGAKVIEGDLVLVTGTRRRDKSDDDEFNPYDDNDDDNIYAQAHAVTAAEVATGKYTIFDVVLPTPGYDVSYPRNEIGEYYVEFMGKPENGALNPFDMRRKQREFSLSGNYRPLIGRLIGDPQYAVRAYRDDTEQMYPTDLDHALHKKNAEKLAKAVAHPGAHPAVNPLVNRWAHFSQNAATYDDAMAAERRRKADEEPPSDAVMVTNETWVQTGADSSAKRVKLARHHQQIENPPNGLPCGDASATIPTLKVKEPEEDASHPRFPVGNGAPLTQDKGDASPPHIFTDGPFPMIPLPKGAIPTSGVRGVSDSYYAETGKIPYFGPLPPGFTMQTNAGGDASQGQEPGQHQEIKVESSGVLNPIEASNLATNTFENRGDSSMPDVASKQVKSLAADSMNWYDANPLNGSMNTAAGQSNDESMALVKVEEPSNADPDTEVINGVTLPKLRTASDNPFSVLGAGIDEGSIDPNADKIAVILKFQLKASNYATIVLRELMGTTIEGTPL